MQDIVFPLMSYSEQDAEMWDTDPYEYIRIKFDIFEVRISGFTLTPNRSSSFKFHILQERVKFHNGKWLFSYIVKIRMFYFIQDFVSPVTAAQTMLHSACKKRKAMLQKTMGLLLQIIQVKLPLPVLIFISSVYLKYRYRKTG
jgi:importin-7